MRSSFHMLYEQEIATARTAALRAGEVALQYWRGTFETEIKSDDSPVTIADREAEKIIVTTLREAFPEDGLVGEEGTDQRGTGVRRWFIDPVDGTRDFVRGSRTWSVQLALEDGENNVVAGVVFFPALDEVYYACREAGAWCNGEPIRVSDVSSPTEAVLCINDLGEFHRFPFGARFVEWAAQFWSIRNPGGSPDAMMVASGKADAWIDPRCKAWDLAPHKIITEEAGGLFRNFDGGSSIYAGNCFTCAPGMEDAIREFVSG